MLYTPSLLLTPPYTPLQVYAFAIIVWELLHGSRPWEGKTAAAIMRAVDRGQRLAVATPDNVLCQLMGECWAHEPADRPTFAAVDARLQATWRTFATSDFKRQYEAMTEPVILQHKLWNAVHGLVTKEARRLGVPQQRADDALLALQRNAFTAGSVAGGAALPSGLQEALDPAELRKLTARVWSSNVSLCGITLRRVLIPTTPNMTSPLRPRLSARGPSTGGAKRSSKA